MYYKLRLQIIAFIGFLFVFLIHNFISMKQTLLLLSLFYWVHSSIAQDRLVSIKNDTLLVKVVEITPKEIKYKMADNPEGPLITVFKNEYASIHYANGTSQILQDAKAIRKRMVYKNSVNIDFMSFLTNEVEVNYERLLNGDMIGIQIPVRIGWRNYHLLPYTGYDNYNYYSYSNNYPNYYQNSTPDVSFSTGAFLKFYYNKPSIVRGYSGIEIIGAVLKSSSTFNYYDYNTSQTVLYGPYKDIQGILGFMALTGFKVTAHPRVTFAIDGGGGYGGLFSKQKTRVINGTEYVAEKIKRGTGIWKVTTSIGINF